MNLPKSYYIGIYNERCWDYGWRITFRGFGEKHPNGWITADKLDESEQIVLTDSVVMPYDEINQIIVNFMESKGIPVPEVKDHRWDVLC